MSYVPIPVTEDNLVTAIQENIRLIRAELAHKVKASGPVQVQADWDLNGNNVKNAANPVRDNEPVNLATLNFYLE